MPPRRLLAALAALVVAALPGCALVATPKPPPVHDASLAPTGPMGYVVCPDAVTPVELDTVTPEAAIPLPLSTPAAQGDFAITAAPDGRWAYVAATIGGNAAPPPGTAAGPGTTVATSAGTAGRSEVVPIDLVGQQAGRPINLPVLGGTHALVVLPGGRTVLVGDGTTLVPVDVTSRRVGAPLDLGAGHTVYGLALAPDGKTLYTLVPGGVLVVDAVRWSSGPEIPTGLTISSVYSPHGIAVSADGTVVYVTGQGGADFGGRVLPIVAATRAPLPPAGFDRYGIADPAALALAPGSGSILVVDSANNWVNPVDAATFTDPPPPVRLPARGSTSSSAGTGHPTDIVVGPGATGAFVVDGFTSVVPYRPTSQRFGRPVPVCSGAASMAVAPAP